MLNIEKIGYKLNQNYLFKNISFNVKKGIIGIYGPSGSGKSTLLKIIGGYIKSEGKILLDGKDIWTDIIKYRKNNGFSFQDYSLLNLTIKDNLLLPFTIGDNKKNEKWIDYLIDYFQIKHILKKNITNISGGEKERVSIIKAFIHKPNIVFLDEAGGALDNTLKNKLYDFIKEYSQKNIIFFISHDKDFKNNFKFKNIVYNGSFEIYK